jgi:glycosyltransferase involved in cell wall biosynthesis
LASNAKPVTLGKEEARRKLNLAIDGNYIVYTGKLLFDEVVEMLEVAERLGRTRPSAVLVLVGGNPEILAKCRSEAGRRKLKNVLFTGFVSPAEVGFYQAAADVLILNLLKNKEIIEYITPSKVFDYLQAARPIVIAEYPILHELLEHEKNALFVPSHSPHLFAAAICKVLDNPGLAASLAEGAAKSSELYSWGGRVRLISGFIKSVSSRTDGTLRENQF